jgi:anti-sigma-K factor RskA
MRYEDPRLLDALAREYVLGTLRGSARSRFARVLSASLGARRAVLAWERHLTPLARAVPAVAPPPETWQRIEATLGLAPPRRHRATAGLWPALAAGLALLAVLFGGLYVEQRGTIEQPTYVSVIEDTTTDAPIWLLQAFERAQAMRSNSLMPRPVPVGNDYELWMLPGGGANPVSLGLISGVANTQLPLSAAQLAVLAQTDMLAVSLEPAGGSPTGLPTGPVIFTAPLLRI